MPFSPAWPTARPFSWPSLQSVLDALVSFVNGVESSAAGAASTAASARTTADSAATTANAARNDATAALTAANAAATQTSLEALAARVGSRPHMVLCTSGVWGAPDTAATVNFWLSVKSTDPMPPASQVALTQSIVAHPAL